MRRFLSVALIGFAVFGASNVAEAQGRPGRGGQRGVMDTARARRFDSLRVARGDTAFGGRRGPDSLRAHRLDSLRAAGILDSARVRRGPDGLGRGRGGPGGPGMMAGRGGLAGIQLTDAEKANIKTVAEKHRAEMQQLRQARAGAQPTETQRQEMQQVLARHRAELRAALTAEHQAQFDANVAKMQQRGPDGARRPGRRPPVG